MNGQLPQLADVISTRFRGEEQLKCCNCSVKLLKSHPPPPQICLCGHTHTYVYLQPHCSPFASAFSHFKMKFFSVFSLRSTLPNSSRWYVAHQREARRPSDGLRGAAHAPLRERTTWLVIRGNRLVIHNLFHTTYYLNIFLVKLVFGFFCETDRSVVQKLALCLKPKEGLNDHASNGSPLRHDDVQGTVCKTIHSKCPPHPPSAVQRRRSLQTLSYNLGQPSACK